MVNFWKIAPVTRAWKMAWCTEDEQKKARPVLHREVVTLARNFLEFKQVHGTSVEKEVYNGMDVNGLIDRLIKKRPLAFYKKEDVWVLPDGQTGKGWKHVGTEKEHAPLLMKDFMYLQVMIHLLQIILDIYFKWRLLVI
jgi:hypothetical protein